jgi:hypothetical protein
MGLSSRAVRDRLALNGGTNRAVHMRPSQKTHSTFSESSGRELWRDVKILEI